MSQFSTSPSSKGYNYGSLAGGKGSQERKSQDDEDGFEYIPRGGSVDYNPLNSSGQLVFSPPNERISDLQIDHIIQEGTKGLDSSHPTIHKMEKGVSNLQNLLGRIDKSRPHIIPYGIESTGLFTCCFPCFYVDHAVLVLVYNNQIYVIDPKKSAKECKLAKGTFESIGLGVQSSGNSIDCGRHTARVAIDIATQLSNNPGLFNVDTALKDIVQNYPDIGTINDTFRQYFS